MRKTARKKRLGSFKLICGDARTVLATLPEKSVHCVVTSPPYWGLRSYLPDDHPGKALELGNEKTPDEYVANIVEVFRAVRRVLRDDGSLWLNMGDGYTSGNRADYGPVDIGRGDRNVVVANMSRPNTPRGLKPKDLIGMPWRVAFALQADGWWLRSDVIEFVEFYCPHCGYIMEERIWRYSQDRDIIWAKPNPMPESCKDRPTKAHEYMFLLTKKARYFYDADAVREESAQPERAGKVEYTFSTSDPAATARRDVGRSVVRTAGRNRRTVWTIPTEAYPGPHYATYPRRLVEPCVLAGSSERGCCPECGAPWRRMVKPGTKHSWHDHTDDLRRGQRDDSNEFKGANYYKNYVADRTIGWQPGCKCEIPGDHDDNFGTQIRTFTVRDPIPCTVLDPFVGSGTTGVVATQLGRRFIGVELNPEDVERARKRIKNPKPMPGTARAKRRAR